jgi:hypothetical protein
VSGLPGLLGVCAIPRVDPEPKREPGHATTLPPPMEAQTVPVWTPRIRRATIYVVSTTCVPGAKSRVFQLRMAMTSSIEDKTRPQSQSPCFNIVITKRIIGGFITIL